MEQKEKYRIMEQDMRFKILKEVISARIISLQDAEHLANYCERLYYFVAYPNASKIGQQK